ncbi:MAG: threonine ammonia-lyase [Pseudomonadales bacterium]
MSQDSRQISRSAVQVAAIRINGQVNYTPCEHSVTLSALTGAQVYLKFENQQFTASFKERGALNRLLALSPAERGRGVIAMSAGNHAQALAYHGQRLGIPTCIVMPRITPNAKVEQTRVFGAEIILEGAQFDETLAFTQTLARQRDLTLIHPFDDPDVIAGQGTLALELEEQVPDADVVIVPIGGGGLVSGVATVLASSPRPPSIVGVQMAGYPAAYRAFYGQTPSAPGAGTVAEGIAVKEPGELTLPVIKQRVEDILLVSESQVEQAIFDLLEYEKTVVEGAGATGLAALYANKQRFAGKKVVLLLSGGNIDMLILSSVLQRGLVRSHRLVRLRVEIQDMPGALADLTRVLGELDSNIMDIVHQRAFGGSSVRATTVELVLQMRGEEQVEQVLEGLANAGYLAQLVDDEIADR